MRLRSRSRRFRPLLLVADGGESRAELQDRARWEARVRAARARRVTVTVQGWRDSDGGLWAPGDRVRVRDEWLGVDAELVVAGVTMTLDEGGRRTVLSLVRADAFNLRPIEEPSPESTWADEFWEPPPSANG